MDERAKFEGDFAESCGWHRDCINFAMDDNEYNDSEIAAAYRVYQKGLRVGREEMRERCVGIIEGAELGQAGWDHGEDIVTLSKKPVGATITKQSREFDRWWPSVRQEIATAIKQDKET